VSATLPVLARNDGLLILDKPAGLPSARPLRGGDSVEERLDGAWLCHRLDTDTAGCLAVATRRPALRAAQQAFAAGEVRKLYWAVVTGVPAASAGTIDVPLLKVSSAAAGWRMVTDPRGQPAWTGWRVLGAASGITLLELDLRTGRTHQARAHCAALGHPVVGDTRYGGPPGPMQLLARSLSLCGLSATAPVPPHMRAAVGACQAEAARR
jgi:23S rRNA-/tRNA-specific pseudouridylate synthase